MAKTTTPNNPSPGQHLLNLRSTIEKLKAAADSTRVNMDDMSGAEKVRQEMTAMKAQLRLQQAESNYMEALRFYSQLDLEADEDKNGIDYDALREIHASARRIANNDGTDEG